MSEAPATTAARLRRITNEFAPIVSVVEAAEAMATALEGARRKHHESEDCWYSCPKSDEGTCNDVVGPDCNCGADEHNAVIDAALARWRGEPEESE